MFVFFSTVIMTQVAHEGICETTRLAISTIGFLVAPRNGWKAGDGTFKSFAADATDAAQVHEIGKFYLKIALHLARSHAGGTPPHFYGGPAPASLASPE